MQGYSIYQLSDPRDGKPRYVGLSSDVFNRFARHILSQEENAKAKWIDELKQAGLLRLLQVLEENIPTIDEARYKEREWIQRLRATGAQLTNVAGTISLTGILPIANVAGVSQEPLCTLERLRAMRGTLGLSQEALSRRTRSLSARTIRNAEAGQRITFDTASQILEAINNIHREVGRPPITIDDLGLTLS